MRKELKRDEAKLEVIQSTGLWKFEDLGFQLVPSIKEGKGSEELDKKIEATLKKDGKLKCVIQAQE